MCGIFGGYSLSGEKVAFPLMQEMAKSIAHRGPDNTNFITMGRCSLGNCRLSIIDLSAQSNQPQVSDDQDITVVQNGEIYNYIEIKEELISLGYKFRSNGDTEVILRAFEAWGSEFVTRLNGMFAIAIYVQRERKLYLYRDRLGVKPLFLYKSGEEIYYFASEIKALLAAGAKPTVDLTAISEYLALNYVPQPKTIFKEVFQLQPGHIATIDHRVGLQIKPYWDLTKIKPENDMTEGEVKSTLITILDDATRIRMRSDARFGAFLSGGLDSSSVVAFMSLYQSESLRTYSIGFDDDRYDESKFAKEVSERYGTIHQMQKMQMNVDEMWPRFIWHCDQPHGDVSFMPTDQLSALAARDVKMVLTGDGADELFAGYNKYADFFTQSAQLNDGWEKEFAVTTGLLDPQIASTLLSGDLYDAFHDKDPFFSLSDKISNAGHHDPINRVLLAETLLLLPSNNLVKPDRMAMANSLEVRSPFLDYRMAEFSFSVPGFLKLKDGETKAIYKKAVEGVLGRTLTYRKKQMFTVPIGDWLRNKLAQFCNEMLLNGRFEARAIFDMRVVTQMISEHATGVQNHTRLLRALISLEIWFRLFIDADPTLISTATNKSE